METLLSYRLSDLLMFSEQTYLRQIELYNQWLFPFQISAYVYGLLCLPAFVKPLNKLARLVFPVSGLCYALVSYGFLWQYYAGINPLAVYLVGLLVIQGVIFISVGVKMKTPLIQLDTPARRSIGIMLWLIALAVYPAIEGLSGRPLSQFSSFVLSPDTLALSSIALMLMFQLPGWLLLPAALYLLSSVLTLAAMNSWSLLLPLTSLGCFGLACFFNGFIRRRPA